MCALVEHHIGFPYNAITIIDIPNIRSATSFLCGEHYQYIQHIHFVNMINYLNNSKHNFNNILVRKDVLALVMLRKKRDNKEL